MYILGIDTATMTGSVAIITEDRVIAEHTLNSKATHTERLLVTIDRVLTSAALTISDVDGIAVASGPGSFTGLRIAVATAKSMAYSQKIPIVAISSLDALASQYLFSDHLICPILDARKKEVYTALYRNRGGEVERVSDYAVIAPDALLKDIREPVIFLGDGVPVYRQQIQNLLGEQALFADPARLLPRGSLIATLGVRRLAAHDTDECLGLTPLYLRKSDAELHWEQAHRS